MSICMGHTYVNYHTTWAQYLWDELTPDLPSNVCLQGQDTLQGMVDSISIVRYTLFCSKSSTTPRVPLKLYPQDRKQTRPMSPWPCLSYSFSTISAHPGAEQLCRKMTPVIPASSSRKSVHLSMITKASPAYSTEHEHTNQESNFHLSQEALGRTNTMPFSGN